MKERLSLIEKTRTLVGAGLLALGLSACGGGLTVTGIIPEMLLGHANRQLEKCREPDMKERSTLNDIHVMQQQWEKALIPEDQRTPQSRYLRLMEEVEELQEEMEDFNPERSREAAMEVVDMMIIGMGLIDSLGYDMENLILEKMETNYKKYNPYDTRQLLTLGYSWEEALQIQKENWNGNGT